MLRRLTGIAGMLLALVGAALAQSQASASTNIRAGIVVIESSQTSGFPANYTPHVWYNLDQDFGVKPAGWNIYNPRAATMMTDAVKSRWDALNASVGAGAAPARGDRMDKSTAAYWEVRLSQVSDTQLSDYDVLLLSAYGFTNLNAGERDKLRKFMDQGGVLWVDTCSTTDFTNSELNTLPLPFRRVGAAAALSYADVFSPLLSNPYALSAVNIEQIRLDTSSFAGPITVNPALLGIESWLDTDYFMHFVTVAASATNPAIMVGQVGDGHMVVTTSQIAMALNRIPASTTSYSLNRAYQGVPPKFDRSTHLAAKLAVNIITLASGHAQSGGGARKTNATPIDLHPPLLRNVTAEPLNTQASQAPVLYKGVMVVSAGNEVRVYDIKPETDLDGDGNPDDGEQDLSLGNTYDLLWSARLPGTISSATCAEVPGANVRDQLFVVDTNGFVYAFDVFALSGGRISASQAPIYTVKPPQGETVVTDTTLPQAGPYAPTFHDGLLYVTASARSTTGPVGIVWIVDPLQQALVQTAGTDEWYWGGQGTATPQPTASPTVGYIPVQDNSGAYDRVLYLPGRPNGVNGPTGTASLTSVWLGVRGESPPPNQIDTSTSGILRINTRALSQNLRIYTENAPLGAYANRALGLKLTLQYPNGDPYSDSDMANYFNGSVQQPTPGILEFGLNTALPAEFAVRLDYSIDYGVGSAAHRAMSAAAVRGNLFFPDDYTQPTNDRRRILGNIAMSPRGTLYCVVSNPSSPASSRLDCGSFYAIREDIGRGGFRLLTRYNLYPEHSMVLNQASPVTYAETLYDNDPVMSMPGFPGQMAFARFTHLTFVGGPSVRDGVVYVAASGRKANPGFFAFAPYTILMAFKGEPEPPEIRVGNIPDGFSLRQYDIDRSIDHTNPKSRNDMNQGQFSYNRSEGTIRFENLMTGNKGPMVNAFSTSQPVIIARSNQPDQVVEPNATGNNWSPLLWYAVQQGVDVTGGPVTTGSSVFVPGQSILPNISDMITNGTLIFSGVMSAWNSAIAPNDQYLVPNGTRPWNRQYYQVLISGGGPSGNPGFLWPSLAGIRDFDDYIVRVRQSALGKNSNTSYGAVAGEGCVASWGNGGAYAFSRADIIVADDNRLGRYDAVGNPLWVVNSTTSSGRTDAGTVSGVETLVRPIKAYPVSGSTDLLVVDAGGNQVQRLDVSGRAVRTIKDFLIDPNAIPEGYKANEPTTLNSPRDAITFNTYELGNTQYWIHYLIADSANKRLVELVDKYNVNPNGQITDVVSVGGVRQLGILYWHSPSNFSGKDFDYNSITRVYEPVSGRYFYAAGIGSSMPTPLNSGLDTSSPTNQVRETSVGNGGVVIIDPTNPSGNLVIHQIDVPTIQQDTFWNFTTGMFQSNVQNGHVKKLGPVNSVTSRVVNIGGQTRIAIMITDPSGVYEIIQPSAGSDWAVRWMLPREAYPAIRRLGAGAPSANNAADLRATYARRLEDGDVIVVNGYLGTTIGGQPFNGEVIQLSGDFNADPAAAGFDFNKPNLGFDLRMIMFQLPPIQGARGLYLPVFADRR